MKLPRRGVLRRPVGAACVGALGLALLAGCQTCPMGKPWGRDVRVLPTWQRLGWAARRALTDPYTIGPAVGAGIFAIGDLDEEVSDWAREHTPVYGSKDSAAEGGIIARHVAMAGGLATALATPSARHPHWGINKAKAIPVQTAGALAPQIVAYWLKLETDRVRPNGKDDLSFPSTISAEAAGWSAVGRRNLRATTISPVARAALDGVFTASTALTAWSRVENGSHYPSDVLAGVALGNAMSLFIQDAFLGPTWRDFQLGVAPGREQMDFMLAFSTQR